MNEEKVVLKALITSRDLKDVIETREFDLNILNHQLAENKLDFIAIGGIIVPKQSIVKIELKELSK